MDQIAWEEMGTNHRGLMRISWNRIDKNRSGQKRHAISVEYSWVMLQDGVMDSKRHGYMKPYENGYIYIYILVVLVGGFNPSDKY